MRRGMVWISSTPREITPSRCVISCPESCQSGELFDASQSIQADYQNKGFRAADLIRLAQRNFQLQVHVLCRDCPYL